MSSLKQALDNLIADAAAGKISVTSAVDAPSAETTEWLLASPTWGKQLAEHLRLYGAEGVLIQHPPAAKSSTRRRLYRLFHKYTLGGFSCRSHAAGTIVYHNAPRLLPAPVAPSYGPDA